MRGGYAMKKVLCLCLALCLSMTTLAVFADTTDSETVEKMILSAKEKFSVSDEKFVFEDYSLEKSEQRNRYTFRWVGRDDFDGSEIHAEMDENGSAIRYYRYDGSKERNQLKYPKKTREEATEAAKQALLKIDAEKVAQVADGELQYDSYERVYSYQAERRLGGLPVFGESLSLQLDADTLELMYYYANWTEGLRATEAELISAERAAETYRDKLGYELFYQVVSQDGTDTVKPVYRPCYEETLYIDAESGEVVSVSELLRYEGGSGGSNDKLSSATMGDASAESVSLSEEERAVLEEISAMLPKEKAEQIARGVAEFEITKDYTLRDYSVSKRTDGSYVGRAAFAKETKDTYGYRNVCIDVQTGEVLSYSGYEHMTKENTARSENKAPSAEQSQKTAELFLKRYYPRKFEKMTQKTVFEPSGTNVSYLRTENGLKVYGNGATFSFDTDTGKLRSFSLEWTDAEFPQAMGAGTEQVYEKLLTADNFRCGYLLSYDAEKKEPFAKAVYRTEDEPVFDAESLQKLDWRLRPITEETQKEYTDIGGHYAEETVKRLSVLGIGYEGSLLRPNEAVTQKEYLALLAQVLYQRSWDDEESFYRYLLRKGVLTQEEIQPEREISRMEGIRYLLNGLGYRDFVSLSGIFLCPFSDVAEADKGYAAVAAGLGLVNTQTDSLYADSALRRADSLIILYRYLNR